MMPKKTKKYSLTDEHRAQLGPWSDKWIANAMRTGLLSDEERARVRIAVAGLYASANLPPPKNIVFAAGPITGALAASISAGVWHLRKHPELFATLAATYDATYAATYAATDAATIAATRDATLAATDDATLAATRDATRDATSAATSAATYAAARAATRDATRDATSAATSAATYAAARAATYAATYAATLAATYAATYAAARAATRDATRDATSAATSAATYAAARAATYAATYDATSAATYAATYAAARAATYAATRDATLAATRDATIAATIAATSDAPAPIVAFLLQCCGGWSNMRNGGSQWSGWASFLSFFRHIATLPLDYSKWDHYETAAIAGPRYMTPDFCIVSEPPLKLTKDEQNQPHCEDGPSHVWADGIELYYWHGTKVPGRWIMNKATVSVAEILAETNADIRTAGLQIVGWKRVLRELSAVAVNVDADPEIGTLYRLDLPGEPGQCILKAQCGTGREVALRVPPTMTTALEANAWTWRLEPSQYAPEVRT